MIPWTDDKRDHIARIEGRLDVLRSWIESLPLDTVLAVYLAERFRVEKRRIIELSRGCQ